MADKSLNIKIKNRKDTSANWTSKNPVLLDGEIIIVYTDAGGVRLKIGDGTKTYTQLPFIDENILNTIANLHDVKYINQTLTDEQKTQARSNIGAGTSDVVISTDLASSGKAADSKITGDTIVDLSNTVSANYSESIIGLSVEGTTVTYIKGDGTEHTFETQDTDTTYSLGTDEVTGLTKLYATTGNAEDGTMTQKAIKTELDKKVGVSIDTTQDMLIFSI